MDVNEKIVLAWFNDIKNMFTISSIDYGKYHHDIDILALELKNKEVWDCEIKVRTGSTRISDSNNSNNKKQNGFQRYVDILNSVPNSKGRGKRNNKIKKIISDDIKIKKKFITNKNFFGKEKKTQEKWIKKFEENDIDVIFIDSIIEELYSASKDLKKSTNEILQVLRLLNSTLSKEE